MPSKMPPLMSPEELKKFGKKFADALTKGQKDADSLADKENKDSYEFGKSIKGKYFKGQKMVGVKGGKKEESVSQLLADIRDLLQKP